MDESYAKTYSNLYQKHFWWRSREKILLELIARHAPKEGFGNILDVGCGDGQFLHLLTSYGATEGIEPSNSSPVANRTTTIYNTSFDENFVPEKKYGLVLMLDSLEHFANQAATLIQARNLLKDNGILLVTVPAMMRLWTSHDAINHHFVRFSKKSMSDLFVRANLEIIDMKYFFQWLAPLKLAIRFYESRTANKVTEIQKVPFWPVNKLAELLSLLEWNTYGQICQSFGSSLYAIARPTKKQLT